jgi:alkanesulfonate monooxygenase SsuD/methylene tetrahydromethanopterin reductase-like flavin-dependent oxidoreductase (luciferase family)
MKHGISIPNFGSYADVRAVAELARDAENAGWDGLFYWDHLVGDDVLGPVRIDPWVALGAIAMRTERIRLGTMVTPIARRRPWKLARETVTLDHLSGGRVTLGVGLGFPPEEFSTFGEDADERTRAERLDEGIHILTGLWSGQEFQFSGKHYQVKSTTFQPQPLQVPRIPVWVAGIWPAKAPMRRAAKWDGAFPIRNGGVTPLTPADVAEISAYIAAHRHSTGPFDFVVAGESSGGGPVRIKEPLRDFESAGVTWWLESINDWRGSFDEMRQLVRPGPPSS